MYRIVGTCIRVLAGKVRYTPGMAGVREGVVPHRIQCTRVHVSIAYDYRTKLCKAQLLSSELSYHSAIVQHTSKLNYSVIHPLSYYTVLRSSVMFWRESSRENNTYGDGIHLARVQARLAKLAGGLDEEVVTGSLERAPRIGCGEVTPTGGAHRQAARPARNLVSIHVVIFVTTVRRATHSDSRAAIVPHS